MKRQCGLRSYLYQIQKSETSTNETEPQTKSTNEIKNQQTIERNQQTKFVFKQTKSNIETNISKRQKNNFTRA